MVDFDDKSPPQPSSSTILLVDDEKQVTQGLSAILRSSRWSVLVAHSGAEALSVLRRCHVDVVVSDEWMPDMCGSELLSIVAREFPNTGRVILTGHATVESTIHAINDGKVCQLIEKPCSPERFRGAVEEALHTAIRARATSGLLDLARMNSLSPSPKGSVDPGGTLSPPRASAMVGIGAFSADVLTTLSNRERDVFDLLIDGLRVSQIAKALFVSEQTVRNHLKSVFGKLDVHSQTELLSKGRGRSG
jgi:DNA-binding NarL/FixJ family response regulator